MSDTVENEAHPLLEAFKPFEHFCKSMLDAYIIIDHQTRILKSNQLFSTLVGKKSRLIQKTASLSELIRFNIGGHALTLSDLLAVTQPTRMDEVRGDTQMQENLNLILSIYPFFQGGKPLGIFLMIRDVTAETNLQDKYKVKATQSITDKLTGLYNRAYFESYLPETVDQFKKKAALSASKKNMVSIVMADIDHFKMINDTYGHQGGDYVLEHVAGIFKNNFRKTDVICRYGGEEFLTILPSTTIDEAYAAADKLRKAVSSYEFKFNQTKIPVTISMGIAQIELDKEKGEETIARADAALYYAKENGRNRVCTNHNGILR